MGMKHVDPGSVSAMLYGAQWVTQNHKYLLSNSNIFTISATEEGSKPFVFFVFFVLEDESIVQVRRRVAFVAPYLHRTSILQQ